MIASHVTCRWDISYTHPLLGDSGLNESSIKHKLQNFPSPVYLCFLGGIGTGAGLWSQARLQRVMAMYDELTGLQKATGAGRNICSMASERLTDGSRNARAFS